MPQAQRDAYTLQATAAENMNPVEVYQLHDAETSITFSREDHPLAIPRPGHAPLVLDAQIGGYDMDRVFMDGCSSMNIIFCKHPAKNADPSIGMEEVRNRTKRRGTRRNLHITRSSRA